MTADIEELKAFVQAALQTNTAHVVASDYGNKQNRAIPGYTRYAFLDKPETVETNAYLKSKTMRHRLRLEAESQDDIDSMTEEILSKIKLFQRRSLATTFTHYHQLKKNGEYGYFDVFMDLDNWTKSTPTPVPAITSYGGRDTVVEITTDTSSNVRYISKPIDNETLLTIKFKFAIDGVGDSYIFVVYLNTRIYFYIVMSISTGNWQLLINVADGDGTLYTQATGGVYDLTQINDGDWHDFTITLNRTTKTMTVNIDSDAYTFSHTGSVMTQTFDYIKFNVTTIIPSVVSIYIDHNLVYANGVTFDPGFSSTLASFTLQELTNSDIYDYILATYTLVYPTGLYNIKLLPSQPDFKNLKKYSRVFNLETEWFT